MSILFGQRGSGARQAHVGLFQKIIMLWVNHFRQAIASLGELWRQRAASLMTIAVLGFSITLPSVLYIMVNNAQRISSTWEQAAEISLFLKQDLSEASINQLLARLSTWPEIDSVKFVSADDALSEFQQVSGFGDALAYLEKNPLPNVVLVIPHNKYAGPSAAGELLQRLRQQREVEEGKLDIEWLERLDALLAIVTDLVAVMGGLLFISVVLIVGNTIRLNIMNKREEIIVMKLVGATDAFIHRPFLYTGFWYGLLGGMIAWCSVTVILLWLETSVAAFSRLYMQSFSLTGLSLSDLMFMLSASVLLGLSGSYLSVRRHVSAIEPR